MRKLIPLGELKKIQERFSSLSKTYENMNLAELQLLRVDLIKTIYEIHIWKFVLKFSRRKISNENRLFLDMLHTEIDEFEKTITSLLVEKEQEVSLHEQWEAELLPEPARGKNLSPKYPALASYDSPDLLSLMDDSWLPIDQPDAVAQIQE